MKPYLLAIISFFYLQASAQYVETANRCYTEKQYQCAADNYMLALQNKKYEQKDYPTIQYRIGKSFLSLKVYDKAILALKEAIQAKPAWGLAYWDLAAAYYQSKDYTNAALNYGLAAPLYVNEPVSQRTLFYYQGYSYFNLANYTESLKALDFAFKLDSNNTSTLALMGDVYSMKGLYREAIRYYTKTITLVSDTNTVFRSSLYYWRGKSNHSIALYKEALEDYKMSLSLDPTRKVAWWDMAAVYYAQKLWKESIESYSKAIALYKEDKVSLKSLYYYRGYSYEQLKDYAKAISDYDEAAKVDPTYYQAYWGKASVANAQKKYKDAIKHYSMAIDHAISAGLDNATLHFMRAKVHMELKDTISALGDFETAATLDKYYPEPNVELAHIYFAEQNYSDAIKYYNAALNNYLFFPSIETESLIYLRRGLCNMWVGNTYTAKADLGEAIKLDSTNRMAHRYLAAVYYTQKDWSMSYASFTTCIRQYANDKDSLHKMYSYRGHVMLEMKQLAGALADFEQAAKLKPSEYGYSFKVGQIAFDLKDYQKAIASFTNTISMIKPDKKSDLAFSYYCRGRCYFELQDKVNAKKDFTKAIEYVPGYKEASTWLAKTQ